MDFTDFESAGDTVALFYGESDIYDPHSMELLERTFGLLWFLWPYECGMQPSKSFLMSLSIRNGAGYPLIGFEFAFVSKSSVFWSTRVIITEYTWFLLIHCHLKILAFGCFEQQPILGLKDVLLFLMWHSKLMRLMIHHRQCLRPMRSEHLITCFLWCRCEHEKMDARASEVLQDACMYVMMNEALCGKAFNSSH